jgi:hypothetical protein
MARRPPPPPAQAALSPDRMAQGITRLERCIAQVEAFDPKSIQSNEETSKSDALSAAVDAALAQTFGHDTVEYSLLRRDNVQLANQFSSANTYPQNSG